MRRCAVCPPHGAAPLCACDVAAVMCGVAGFARIDGSSSFESWSASPLGDHIATLSCHIAVGWAHQRL